MTNNVVHVREVLTYCILCNILYKNILVVVFIVHCRHGVRCRGGMGGGRPPPPDFGGKFFNTFRPPQILAGFVVKCFNSIIKFVELRE